MRKLFFALALVPALVLAAPKIVVKCDVANGAKVSGDVKFTVTVDSKSLITKVEYYVNDELKDSDDSTPYEFKLDTLKEKEGPCRVKFSARTDDGDEENLVLTLNIDNELSKGLAYWVDQSVAFSSVSNWSEAVRAGRIAVKIAPKDAGARTALARAYFGKGELDRAQQIAEDVLAADENNYFARDLISAVNLRQAFKTGINPKEPKSGLDLLKTALTSAASNRAKVYELQLTALGKATDENRLKIADIAIRGARYSVAIDALKTEYTRNMTNAPVVNRLMYAYIRAGKIRDAIGVATNYMKRGAPDGEGFALIAILLDRAGDANGAADAERNALINDASSLGVRTAQAYLAGIRNQKPTLKKIVDQLMSTASQRPEVGFYRDAVLSNELDYEGSRSAFEQAVLAEPAMEDLYVQQAGQSMELTLNTTVDKNSSKFALDSARVYLEAALAAKPESYQAFTGLGLVELLSEKPAEAAAKFRIALKIAPEYAAASYALSYALSLEDQRLTRLVQNTTTALAAARSNKVQTEVDRLSQVLSQAQTALGVNKRDLEATVAAYKANDPKVLSGMAIPDSARALNYYNRYGRVPVLILRAP